MGLVLFLRFLSFKKISPNSVDDQVAQQYLEMLEKQCLVKTPRVAHQNMCRELNKAVERFDIWPRTKLTKPVYREPWCFPWEAFPTSLVTQLDDFYEQRAELDFFDDEKTYQATGARDDQNPKRSYSVHRLSIGALWHSNRQP